MPNILDRVAAQYAASQFTPATTQEYFALRLAQKLHNADAAGHYIQLLEQHSTDQLLAAYHNATTSHRDTVRHFHQQLEYPQRGFRASSSGRLAAIRIDRRALAVAIFSGDHLKHADGVHLSPTEDKAASTIAAFLTNTLTKFPVDSAVQEPSTPDIQRARLHATVSDVLRGGTVSITEIEKQDVFASFRFPPAKWRKEVRTIMAAIYPVLGQVRGAPWTYDAAALGLYLQTERLFTLNSSSL